MSARDFLPEEPRLSALRDAADRCRGCELYRQATQTVFGAGSAGARMVFVGEQPGDEKDAIGRPFVGPAGRLLDEALASAGVARGDIYITNAVKHFKWKPRGKRRLHQKPNAAEVQACKPWLLGELAAIRPEVLVLLGATAAQSLLGPSFRVLRSRGVLFPSPYAPHTMATVHPSSLLRITDPVERRAARAVFLREMELAAGALDRSSDAAHR